MEDAQGVIAMSTKDGIIRCYSVAKSLFFTLCLMSCAQQASAFWVYNYLDVDDIFVHSYNGEWTQIFNASRLGYDGGFKQFADDIDADSYASYSISLVHSGFFSSDHYSVCEGAMLNRMCITVCDGNPAPICYIGEDCLHRCPFS